MAKVIVQIARRQWKCEKCGKVIEKGDTYKKISSIYGTTNIRCDASECDFSAEETEA